MKTRAIAIRREDLSTISLSWLLGAGLIFVACRLLPGFVDLLK